MKPKLINTESGINSNYDKHISFYTPVYKTLINTFFTFLLSLTLSSCVTLHEDQFFMPENHGPLPPEEGVIAEKLAIESQGNTLSGVLIKNASSDYLLFFYGNGQSIYEAQKRLYFLSREHNLNVVCFDYRGYGSSTGKTSFDALMTDAAVIYDYVRNTYKPKRLYMFSQSVGTVPCTFLGSTKEFEGIIMEAGFTCAKDAVHRLNEGAPFLPIRYWVKLTADEALLNRKPQPIDFITDFSAPLLYLHGDADEVFPQDIGKKLFEAAGSKDKLFCSLPGTGHSNVNISSGVAAEAVKLFFEKHKR